MSHNSRALANVGSSRSTRQAALSGNRDRCILIRTAPALSEPVEWARLDSKCSPLSGLAEWAHLGSNCSPLSGVAEWARLDSNCLPPKPEPIPSSGQSHVRKNLLFKLAILAQLLKELLCGHSPSRQQSVQRRRPSRRTSGLSYHVFRCQKCLPYCQERATPGTTTCKWTDGWISTSPAATQLFFDLAKEADCNALRKHHLDFLISTWTLYML